MTCPAVWQSARDMDYFWCCEFIYQGLDWAYFMKTHVFFEMYTSNIRSALFFSSTTIFLDIYFSEKVDFLLLSKTLTYI